MFLLLALVEPQLAAVFTGVASLRREEVKLHVFVELGLLVKSVPAHAAGLLLQSDVVTIHVPHALVTQLAAIKVFGFVVNDFLTQFALHCRVVICQKCEVVPDLPLLVRPGLRDGYLHLACIWVWLLDAPPLPFSLPDPDLMLSEQVLLHVPRHPVGILDPLLADLTNAQGLVLKISVKELPYLALFLATVSLQFLEEYF